MLPCTCHESYELTQVLTAKFTNSMNLEVPLSRGSVFEELKLFADEVVFA